MTISSGQLLADRYKLTSRIAVGGMGEVWQASDTRLDRTVAVKILKAELTSDAEFLHRFRTEARTTASLNHPGIAAVHDYGEASSGVPSPDGDRPSSLAYLVMELVKGEPLAAILAREGRIRSERLLPILQQAGKALNAAHEHGLVHRDVKPGNILVSRAADGTETVKITDFGIAKAGHAAPVTRGGMVMGTAHYIAPEQATGQEATPASDVYSLAVCGYECLAGRRPFLSDHAVTVAMMHIHDAPPPLPADVPPTVRALIESTLVKDPARRYAVGGEFADAVTAVMSGHPPPAPIGLTQTPPRGMPAPGPAPTAAMPPPMSPPSGAFVADPRRDDRRGTWLWVTLAVVSVALIVMAVVLLLMMREPGPEQDPGTPPAVTSTPTEEQPPPAGTTEPDEEPEDEPEEQPTGDESPAGEPTPSDEGPETTIDQPTETAPTTVDPLPGP